MPLKLLVAALNSECSTYVKNGRDSGVDVRILDCLEPYHKQLLQQFGDAVLHVRGHRGEVSEAVSAEQFDVAIVHEDPDFVQTALIVQSLHQAAVPSIIVVTDDSERRTMYRRLGAQNVVLARTADVAWTLIEPLLPVAATA